LDYLDDRPNKRCKKNFIVPTDEEKYEIKIQRAEKKLKKKQANLDRVEKLEKKLKTEKETLSSKIQNLKNSAIQDISKDKSMIALRGTEMAM